MGKREHEVISKAIIPILEEHLFYSLQDVIENTCDLCCLFML